LVPTGYASFGLSLAFPFYLPYDGSGHQSFIGFLWSYWDLKFTHVSGLNFKTITMNEHKIKTAINII
jgi:hypothetical protein